MIHSDNGYGLPIACASEQAARRLGVPVDALFRDEPPEVPPAAAPPAPEPAAPRDPYVVRRHERSAIGIEMVLVRSGRLEITLGNDRYELAPGDSMCLPSATSHRYANPTDGVARAVTVIRPGDTSHRRGPQHPTAGGPRCSITT